MTLKQRVHETIEDNALFNCFLITLIILNVLANALESVPSVRSQYSAFSIILKLSR
jgi:hypothetical protein